MRLLALILIIGYVSAEAAERSTYIIHMDKSHMPQAFTGPNHWYSSTVDSIKIAQPTTTSNGHQSPARVLYTYDNAVHGFSAVLSKDEMETMKKLPGFLSAYCDRQVTVDTTHTFEFMKLNPVTGLWPASDYGKDVIIGVIDTGVWPESKSYHDEGLTAVPSKWKGTCEEGQEFNSSLCNLKLIGARYFNKGVIAANPIDNTLNPILDNGYNLAVASPIAMGASQIDPNSALDRGLVYDATPQDYANILCSFNFTTSQIKTITRSNGYNCANPSSDLNYPSFIALYNDEVGVLVQKFERTVTNVGYGGGTYKAKLTAPAGTTVTVSPKTLVFGRMYDKQSYSLTIKYRSGNLTFGSIVWVEEKGKHTVRSPIVVAPRVEISS